MTRKIKFRGKSVDGQLVYGIPIKTHIGTYMVTEENPHVCSEYEYMEIDEFVKVDENTIDQYTGLYDKNGKEIYEGDIIKMSTFAYGDEVFRIGYEDSHIGAFCLCSAEEEDTSRFVGIFGRNYGYEPFYCEVIGNIHDNLELLKE